MRRLVLALSLVIASVIPAAAQGPYVSVSGGATFLHESDVRFGGGSGDLKYDTGYAFNVAAGYDFKPIRVEAEYGYRAAGVDDSDADVTIMSYMVNGYWDLKNDTPFTPLFGLGIGMVNGEIDADGDDFDDLVFGYQLTAGFTAPVGKNMNIDLYYRFQGAAPDFEEQNVKVSYHSSNVFLGLRYSF